MNTLLSYDWGLTESGPTTHYWLVVPTTLTLSSMLITVMAQAFSCMWGEIELKPRYKNKPKSSSVGYYILNHSMASLLASFIIIYTKFHGTLYESNVFEMDITQLTLYIVKVLLWVLIQVVIYDFFIYIFHRTCHINKTLYKYVHMQHHENNSPRSVLDAIYGDALESTIIAFFAVGQMMVFPMPVSSVVLFLFLISFFVQINHSGRKVKIPLLYTYELHTAHHRYFKVNFAEHLMLWDFVFGTINLQHQGEGY